MAVGEEGRGEKSCGGGWGRGRAQVGGERSSPNIKRGGGGGKKIKRNNLKTEEFQISSKEALNRKY